VVIGMSEFDIYNDYMHFLVADGNSRVLGQQSITTNIINIYKYWVGAIQRGEWGNTTNIVLVYNGPRFIAFRVNDIYMGGVKMNMWYWGLRYGRNTVETKVGFWGLAIIPPIIGINTVLPSPPAKLPAVNKQNFF
jgi:hypothetical protein